ncbi:hypothetical protein EPO33_04335 [Patescibacteria group bacterium]|nr:MAG: hypothetical protein EPO33_04335 [Patescibacteria group bacterium]
MEKSSDQDGPPTRRERPERPSTKLLFPRVLVVGTESHLRSKILGLLQARGFKAEALDSGIGAMEAISRESYNTVVVLDLIDAMSQEAVIRLLRGNARTKDLGIIAFVDPRAEPPEGVDTTFGKGTLSNLTDVIADVCEARAGR